MKQFFPNSKIVTALNENFLIQVSRIEFLPLGADRNAEVYKVESEDGRKYFLKLKQNYNKQMSLAITRLLHEKGIEEVILPIQTIHETDTYSTEGITFIIYPFIEGEDGFTRRLTKDQWIQLGSTLRQIHELKLSVSLQSQMKRETYSNRWREAVRKLVLQGSNADEIALKLLQFMNEKREIIDRLVSHAEELSEKVKNLPSEFVLCHADIHGGNVLIDNQNKIYIVDWDDPIMAPKERDLMFIGGGVGNIWNNPQDEEFFYQGYGETEINKTILSYYRFERIVVDIAEFYEEMFFMPGKEEKITVYEMFIAMFNPNGVVDIAFQSLK